MYSFELTPYERTLGEKRHRDFVKTGTEEDFSTIVFERMLERHQLELMLANIDADISRAYGRLHPHQVARYGTQGVQNMLRETHPEMPQFYFHHSYYIDALLIRERAWKNLRRIIALKRFAMRITESFLDHYYRPPWGRGCRRAIRRLKHGFKVNPTE